jgi:hypothetical protein
MQRAWYRKVLEHGQLGAEQKSNVDGGEDEKDGGDGVETGIGFMSATQLMRRITQLQKVFTKKKGGGLGTRLLQSAIQKHLSRHFLLHPCQLLIYQPQPQPQLQLFNS